MPATQIAQRQIKDGAINDAKVAAGAGIASTKLADGAEFLRRNGSVVMTGVLDANNNTIQNLPTPTLSHQASPKSYVDTQIAALNALFDSKGSARAASTGNVVVSNPGTASFDGVTLSNGDRLVLRAQSLPQENGIYVFNGSGSALTRAADMDAWTEVSGAFVAVEEGSTYADALFLCTSNASGGTLGTTAITWQQVNAAAGLLNTNFIDNETPTGTINGSNTAFTLANTPVAGSVSLYLNGQLLVSGAGNDFTISGTAITMIIAPLTGDVLIANYRR
jgi:hypothetical protein